MSCVPSLAMPTFQAMLVMSVFMLKPLGTCSLGSWMAQTDRTTDIIKYRINQLRGIFILILIAN